jgi:3-oxoacyl-[acyl-carrier protein] reductase
MVTICHHNRASSQRTSVLVTLPDQRLLPTPEAQRKWVQENCPVGYIGEPDDLAVLVAFLSSPKSRYITGQVIHVDGGARRFSH